MRRLFVGLAVAMLSITGAGCVSVPRNAPATSEAVTTGLETLRAQQITIIERFAVVTRENVDSLWQREMFARVEAATIEKLKKDDGYDPVRPMTTAQRLRLTRNALAVREKLMRDVDAAQARLVRQTTENFDNVIAINRVIVGYLQSAVKVEMSRQDIIRQAREMVGFRAPEVERVFLELESQIGKELPEFSLSNRDSSR